MYESLEKTALSFNYIELCGLISVSPFTAVVVLVAVVAIPALVLILMGVTVIRRVATGITALVP